MAQMAAPTCFPHGDPVAMLPLPGEWRKRVKVGMIIIGLIALSFMAALFGAWIVHGMSRGPVTVPSPSVVHADTISGIDTTSGHTHSVNLPTPSTSTATHAHRFVPEGVPILYRQAPTLAATGNF